MSPTKQSSSAPVRLLRPASKMASSIPRRVKPAAAAVVAAAPAFTRPRRAEAKIKAKAPSRSTRHDSIFNDSTATALPAKVTSYFSNPALRYGGDENKENIPLSGYQTRSRTNRMNNGGVAASPTRGKTAVSKLSKFSPSAIKRSTIARLPLRELSQDEIFERDAAALGDLRRRRSGEHSGTYIEFDSQTAAPDMDTVVEAEDQASSVVSTSTMATIVDENSRIRVLRRTDSEEYLRLKVEAIMAATAATATTTITKKSSILRKKLYSPMKLKHPAIRGDSPIHSGTTTPLLPSPDRYSLSPTKQSPILGRQSAAIIVKAMPSPVRPTRMGLSAKSANTILKEAISSSKENAGPMTRGKKMVISSMSNNAVAGPKKAVLGKKNVNSSLRRAAGSSRAGSAAPVAAAVGTGLGGIRRMR